ncbi:FG-GAP-like repeat-containing protein [Streptomyces sp. HNM0645]|uniref:FG-GAP-like repeat-containing protein n=1 Tax=Streptomyces sp. HNM0645 TaxID=2782343 RepID=UPI0024B7A455|nr:FG-GAP-like repeat-containing protein [Streptomyces sp. HNM0645]MDI9884260.1 FG-GAP-like repeat-containing protein [Streptomyces sp. HNM0645]
MASAVATLAAAGAIAPFPAQAATGSPVADSAYAFTARIEIGDGENKRACTGALVEARWVLTAASCFTGGLSELAPGKPQSRTVATVGPADLSATGGHASEVVDLVPRAGRDLVLARLAQPAAGITPVPMAATPAAEGDSLTVAGYGRTKTEWVPGTVHTAQFTVNAVTETGLDIAGKSAGDAICKGDTGAPLLRHNNGKPELVAVANRSWQGGCLGETGTRTDATAAPVDKAALGSRLLAGQRLLPGDSLASAGARLTMRTDGDLTITNLSGRVLWATGTAGNDGATARLDAGGNLVVRNAGDTATLWESRTTAAGGHAVLQDRGNLVVHNARNESQWSSGSAPRRDVNGDGISDMADWYEYADGRDGLHTFAGTADGKLAAPHQAFRSEGNQWTLALTQRVTGDFNGDGRADVAVVYDYSDRTAKLWTFLGRADGGFQAPTASWTSSAGSWDASRTTLHAGDFNADGRDDIAAWYDYENGSDALFTFTADGRGGFAAPVKGWSAPNNWTAAKSKYVTGDFNGDGRDDLVVLYDYAEGAVKLWTFLATPTGGFNAPLRAWTHDTWGDWGRTGLYAGDFDADGRDDVALWYDYPDGRDVVHRLTAAPNGTFAAPKAAMTVAAGSLTYQSMKIVTGDYNGDGRDDLGAMYGYSDGNVRMFTWLMNADNAFDTAKTGWTSASASSWDFPRTHFLRQDG